MRTYFQTAPNWEESPTPEGMELCATFTNGDIPVALAQSGDDAFAVVYGQQVHDDLTYAEACMYLGQALMHSLSCAGKLDQL